MKWVVMKSLIFKRWRAKWTRIERKGKKKKQNTNCSHNFSLSLSIVCVSCARFFDCDTLAIIFSDLAFAIFLFTLSLARSLAHLNESTLIVFFFSSFIRASLILIFVLAFQFSFKCLCTMQFSTTQHGTQTYWIPPYFLIFYTWFLRLFFSVVAKAVSAIEAEKFCYVCVFDWSIQK